MTQPTIDDFLPTRTGVEVPIEQQIIRLFKQLPEDRQEAILEELTQIWDEDDDGLEVEIIDDDEPNLAWDLADIIDNEQPLGSIDDDPIHLK